MDETKTIWFRWIAEHSKYFFWAVWGAAVGALGAIACQAVAMKDDDILKLYLAAMTVMMGGTLGLVASRGMDRLSDERKIRRKIMNAIHRMFHLRWELQNLGEAVEEMRGALAQNPTIKASLLSAGQRLVVRMDRSRRAAEAPPEFDELLRDFVDLEIASKVGAIFDFVREEYSIKKDEVDDEEKALPHARNFVLTEPPGQNTSLLQATALLRWETHFAARLPPDLAQQAAELGQSST